MMSSVAVNGVLGFIMLITLCFTLGEVDKVLDTPTGFPFIEIFYNTTGSFAATNAMTAVLVVTLTASTITEVATASRQLWSFARDEGLPFSSFFAYVGQATLRSTKEKPLTSIRSHLAGIFLSTR
jgi:amino acid transporter